VRIAGKGERIRARSRRERGGGIPSPNGLQPATPKAWILSIGPRRFAPTYTSGNFGDFFHGGGEQRQLPPCPPGACRFSLLRFFLTLGASSALQRPEQSKLCEIERFCTESLESASPGLIAQSNPLRISNLVTFSTDQPAPRADRMVISKRVIARELLPKAANLKLFRLEISERGWDVEASGNRSAKCPTCAAKSRSRHSRYRRKLQDLPVQGSPVRFHLQVGRWRAAMTDVRAEYLPSAYRSWPCLGHAEPTVCARWCD
jgi:hypothetical protein